MKILFGTEHYGKDTSECPSGFLIWIIEKYLDADWLLINACKTELSSRFKIDWTPPTKADVILSEQLEAEKNKVRSLTSRIEWYSYIIRAHGINLNYFLLLGKGFAISLFFRTKREGSVRLPEAFADNEIQKAPFNIFAVTPPTV